MGRALVRSQLVSVRFFIDIKSFRSHYGPGCRLSLYQKWVPGAFPGSKGGRCVRLTTLPPSFAVVMKYGNLNFLEPSGPLQACNGTALLFYLFFWKNTDKAYQKKYLLFFLSIRCLIPLYIVLFAIRNTVSYIIKIFLVIRYKYVTVSSATNSTVADFNVLKNPISSPHTTSGHVVITALNSNSLNEIFCVSVVMWRLFL